MVKQKEGRRNRYQIQAHLPMPDPAGRERTIGEVLALLAGQDQPGTGSPFPAEPAAALPGR